MVVKFKAAFLFFFCVVSVLAAGCKKGEQGHITASPVPINSLTPEPEEVVIQPEDKEARAFGTLVKAGMLPNLSNRLPVAQDICVLPLIRVGKYGGSAALASVDITKDAGELFQESLFVYAADGSITGNVASTYSVNEDKTVYTIVLREKMRWSDGTLFTSDDCIFFYEKLCLPELFSEKLFSCFQVKKPDGSIGKASFQKVDEKTFQVIFPAKKQTFLQELLAEGGVCYAPEHYFVNILPEYMTEKASLLKVKDMGYSSLTDFLTVAVRTPSEVYGLPTISPYLSVTEKPGTEGVGSSITYVRNPYYWKTDSYGRQLPYLDSVIFTKLSSESQGVFLAAEGYLSVYAVKPTDLNYLESRKEAGGYQIVSFGNENHFAVQSTLMNFPEGNRASDYAVRGLGATEVSGWYLQ